MAIPFEAQVRGLPGGEVLVKSLTAIVDQLQTSPLRCGSAFLRTGVKIPEGNEVGSIGDLYLRVDPGSTLGPGFVNPPGFLAAGGSDLPSQACPTLWTKGLGTETVRGWTPVGGWTRIATAQPADIGTINNWVPGAAVGVPQTALLGNTIINWGPGITSDATINGIPRGYNGQVIVIRNNSASNIISFAHNNTGSTYGNRFANLMTSAATPVLASGMIAYEYDGTIWSQLWHEQGAWRTWTPAITFGGAAVGLTYSNQQGISRLSGQYVTVSGRVTLTAKGTSVGQALMTSLPYTVGATYYGALFCPYYAGMSGLVDGFTAYLATSSTNAWLQTGGAAATVNLADTNFTDTSDYIFWGAYRVT